MSEELFYPNTRVDGQNRPLSGASKYVLRFENDQIPPVSVFCNLAMYDDKEFFIENDFKRYTIGSTTDELKTDADARSRSTSTTRIPAPTSSRIGRRRQPMASTYRET